MVKVFFEDLKTTDKDLLIEDSYRKKYVQKYFGNYLVDSSKDADLNLSIIRVMDMNTYQYPIKNQNIDYWFDWDCIKEYFGREIIQYTVDECIKQIRECKTGFVIKSIRQKYFMQRYKEKPSDGVIESIIEEMLCMFMNTPEDKPVLLFQPWVDMRKEYRFFVYDSKIVCGTGCIDWFTPDENPDKKQYDLRVLDKRLNSEEIIQLEVSEFHEKYLKTANEIVDKLKKADKTEYTLDMCLIEGVPCIVELNPISNSGFYACDCERLYQTLHEKFILKNES